MSQGTRSKVARRKQMEDEEESRGPLYLEKPTHIIQGSDCNKLLQDIWQVVKDEEGMQNSDWTEWAAKNLMENLNKFHQITGREMTPSAKVKDLLKSVRKNTNAQTTMEYQRNKKIVTISFPQPPAQEQPANPYQGIDLEENTDKEDNDQSGEEQQLLLAQRSVEEDLEGIKESIIEITNNMERKVDETIATLDQFDDTEPNSQDAEIRKDFIQTLKAVTTSMSQLVETTTRKLDTAPRTKTKKYMDSTMRKMYAAHDKRMKDLEGELAKKLEKSLLNKMQTNQIREITNPLHWNSAGNQPRDVP